MKRKVIIGRVLRITAGGLHCYCSSNIGIIKKENKNVPDSVWDNFINNVQDTAPPPTEIKTEDWEKQIKPSWWKRLLTFIKKLLRV